MVKIFYSFDFALHVMSQLVPQMKEEIPQPSEIPQWDSIGILAVHSSGLFLFKLAGIHRITGYLKLEEEFIWSSTPAGVSVAALHFIQKNQQLLGFLENQKSS